MTNWAMWKRDFTPAPKWTRRGTTGLSTGLPLVLGGFQMRRINVRGGDISEEESQVDTVGNITETTVILEKTNEETATLETWAVETADWFMAMQNEFWVLP